MCCRCDIGTSPAPRSISPTGRRWCCCASSWSQEHPDLAGIVIGHGTATLEETAYFLNLTLKVSIPVVLVGAQRPSSALSSDAGMNLVNAIRVAASPEARGMGVLVVLNDEIHAAREVTKTSTLRLQTFRTPDFGVLGHADGDAVAFYRRPIRRRCPGHRVRHRGAGRVAAGRHLLFLCRRRRHRRARRRRQGHRLRRLRARLLPAGRSGGAERGGAPGLVVVQSTRAGSGRTFRRGALRQAGMLIADNLNPQKARMLLALALTVTRDPEEIMRIFRTY